MPGWFGMTPLEARERYDACAGQQREVWKQISKLESEKQKLLDVITGKDRTAPPGRLCDECNIIEVETKLCDVEQDLKDEKEATLAVYKAISDAIENQKDHKEFLLSRDTKDIVLDIIDAVRSTAKTSEG
jgi:hypothetical protein